MSQLHQMQITFVPVEDRLLFRLNTQGRQRQEFRFWFTRRYVKLLWDALIKMLKARQPEDFKTEPSKAVALSAEHKQAVSKADFQTAYEETHIYPLGEDPILAVRVALKQAGPGLQVLCLHPQDGEGLEFNLNNQLLHSFCQLLVNACRQANWDIDLNFGEAEDLISKRPLN